MNSKYIIILIFSIIFSGCIEINSQSIVPQNSTPQISETILPKYTNIPTPIPAPEKIKTSEELNNEYINRIIVTGSNESDLKIVKRILSDTNHKTLRYIKEIHVVDVENLDCESSNIFCYANYGKKIYESKFIIEEQSSIIYTPASNMWSLFKSETTTKETKYGTMKSTTQLCSSFEHSLVKKIGIIDARKHGLQYEDRIIDKSEFPPEYTSNFYSEGLYVDYYAGYHTIGKIVCG